MCKYEENKKKKIKILHFKQMQIAWVFACLFLLLIIEISKGS